VHRIGHHQYGAYHGDPGIRGEWIMTILVLNAGSSSLKYKLFTMEPIQVLAEGIVEEIGEGEYHDALVRMESVLREHGLASLAEVDAVGHRVVHGGERFVESTRIDAAVIEAIEALIPLAPLHNPANLEGIRTAMALAPAVPQVAVFDTAFHQTMPSVAYRYALPRDLYKEVGIRRYGFHGTSHAYVARRAAMKLDQMPDTVNLITLHLGNGASVCAIKGGKSVDTSMGFTPLEGLVMGSRSGDIDPAILFFLARERGYSLDELDRLLNRESGLEGLCGEHDMRRIHARIAEGDRDAALALEIFVYRIRKYIGAYVAVLGRVDALIFTGGIGENDAVVREQILRDLPFDIPVQVIPTNEEREIAEQTKNRL
jgi:acetate kinase